MRRGLSRNSAIWIMMAALFAIPAVAQHEHSLGSGHLWPADLSILELTGALAVTGTAPELSYFLDDDGDQQGDYQLMLGPWWYASEEGVPKPVDGDTITVVGTVVDAQSSPPVVTVFSINGETWRTAVQYGMHGWNGEAFWSETGDTLTVSGSVLVDTTFFYHQYFLDENQDGLPEYRLGFGPAWYQPEGVFRPQHGQVVAVWGIVRPRAGLDLLSVYTLDDQTWRRSGHAAPWAGNWFDTDHADSLFAFCANDSVHWLAFPSGHMDGHRMGMGWPDSSLTQFWRIHPDSLPGPDGATHLMGFYVDIHDPFGMSMMDGRFGHHGGMMQFSREASMRLVYQDEDLVPHNGMEDHLSVRFWDSAAGQWLPVETATLDSQNNTITILGSELSKYYSVGVLGSVTAIEDVADGISDFVLSQNYPNPFNPTTTIYYDLPQAADVRLSVYDLLGREIRELVSVTQPAGTYEVTFDATGLPSGIFFYRLQAADYSETRRMVVVK